MYKYWMIFLLLNETHGQILLFSCSDDEFAQKYKQYIEINTRYAKKHNYTYMYSIVNNNSYHPQLRRMFALENLLYGRVPVQKQHYEWLAYIDSDAFIQQNRSVISIIETANKFRERLYESSACYFIAQEYKIHYPHINSGFWIIKNTTWSRTFVSKWINQTMIGGFRWHGDQGPLCMAILEMASEYGKKKVDLDCWKSQDHFVQYQCWNMKMTKVHMQEGRRARAHMCILPARDKYRFHVQNDPEPNDFVWHGKLFPRTPILAKNIRVMGPRLGLIAQES